MNAYRLKTRADFFARIWDGEKTCEVRKCGDRDFQVGDNITLMELPPEGAAYKEWERFMENCRTIKIRITHVLRGEEWGLMAGYAALSFFKLTQNETPEVEE